MMWFQRHEEPKNITDEYEQVGIKFCVVASSVEKRTKWPAISTSVVLSRVYEVTIFILYSSGRALCFREIT